MMKHHLNDHMSVNAIPSEKVLIPIRKRVRPWERMGFRNKREFMLMKKKIHNLVWKNRSGKRES